MNPNAAQQGVTRLTARGEGGVVDLVLGIDAQAAAGERLPEKALVSTVVAVSISLDDGIATSQDCELSVECHRIRGQNSTGTYKWGCRAGWAKRQ